MLIGAAARVWGVPAAECRAENALVFTGQPAARDLRRTGPGGCGAAGAGDPRS